MPSSTPKQGFPYPDGADPVDVAGDLQRLASAIDLDWNPLVVKATEPTAADYGLLTIPLHAIWIQSP